MLFTSKLRTLLRKMGKLEVVIPQYEKCFFCIPLKQGLMSWGIIQTIVVTTLTVLAVVHFESHIGYRGDKVTAAVMFAVTVLFGVVDNAFNVMLAVNARKEDCRRLNWCYNYYLAKSVVYAGIMVLSITMFTCCYSYNWYYYNLDPWRYWLLQGNFVVGILDCLLQYHLAILVRSYLLQLGGSPQCLFKRRQAAVLESKTFVHVDATPALKHDSYDKQALYAVE